MRFFSKPKPVPAVRAALRAKVAQSASHHLLGHTFEVADDSAFLTVNPCAVSVGEPVQLELITFDGRTLRLTAKVTDAQTLATRDKPAGVGVSFVQPSQSAV